MKKITVDEIMSWEPCEEYPKSRVIELFSGRERITPVDVLKMDIPYFDKLWTVLRPEIFRDIDLQFMACDFVESVINLIPNNYQSLLSSALNIKREFLKGEILRNYQEFDRLRYSVEGVWWGSGFNLNDPEYHTFRSCLLVMDSDNILAGEYTIECAKSAIEAKGLPEQEKQIAIILKYLERG
jgi:hypothetical protein